MAETTTAPRRVGVEDVERLQRQRPGTRLIDVRTPAEFRAEHIPGSVNVPLDALAAQAAALRGGADPIVLVCRSGRRAQEAAQRLQAVGLAHLCVLDGGVEAWKAAGRPVRTGRPALSLERQVRIVAGLAAALGGILAAVAHPGFGWVAGAVGSGLVVAGVTDTCLLGSLLARMPWNRAGGAGAAGSGCGGASDRGPCCG